MQRDLLLITEMIAAANQARDLVAGKTLADLAIQLEEVRQTLEGQMPDR